MNINNKTGATNIFKSAMQGYGLSIVIALISALLIYFIFSPTRPSFTLHAEDTLVRSIVFFRHGDRGPITTYPTDPHPFTDRKKWPLGTDGLTKKGKRDSHALGKLLRRRYKNFLPEVYYPADIIAYATNKERTHSTAALVLAGLYPPTAEELWTEDLPWHPIPIYGDIIFNNTIGIGCPRYKEEVLNLFIARNESFKQEYEQLITYLSQHTGLNMVKDPFLTLLGVGDCLNMQSRSGFELPDWAKEIFPHKLLPLFTEIYNLFTMGTDVQLQLGGGPIIQRLLDIFTKGKRKLYLNSGHDLTLMMLQGAIGVPTPITIPNPTGAVIVELHNVSGNSIVKAFTLQHGAYHHFEPLQLGCGSGINECLLNDFEKMASNLTVDDYNRLCNEIETDITNEKAMQALGSTNIPLY